MCLFYACVSGNRAMLSQLMHSISDKDVSRAFLCVLHVSACVYVCAKQCTFLREVRFGLIKTDGRRRMDRRERDNTYIVYYILYVHVCVFVY